MGMKHHYSLRKIAAALSCIFIASVTFAGTSLTANAAATSITRISGNTRYETMGMVSRAAFLSAPPSKAAVVASGTDFPDALAASSLAGHLNAPILLTDPKSLSNETANELNRLDANAIFVIGGNKAVSHNVENEIRATHPSATITRLTGSTRFDTAHSIYNELATLGAKPQTAIISTGFNFADALSISPYSYMQSAPFFLSSQSGLDEASLNTLRNFQTAIMLAANKQSQHLSNSSLNPSASQQ